MSWPLIFTESYDGPCPLDHPATWATRSYGNTDNNYEYRSVATFECPTCDAAPSFDATLVGGPHHDSVTRGVRPDTRELLILGGQRYVRRLNGIYFHFRPEVTA